MYVCAGLRLRTTAAVFFVASDPSLIKFIDDVFALAEERAWIHPATKLMFEKEDIKKAVMSMRTSYDNHVSSEPLQSGSEARSARSGASVARKRRRR